MRYMTSTGETLFKSQFLSGYPNEVKTGSDSLNMLPDPYFEDGWQHRPSLWLWKCLLKLGPIADMKCCPQTQTLCTVPSV